MPFPSVFRISPLLAFCSPSHCWLACLSPASCSTFCRGTGDTWSHLAGTVLPSMSPIRYGYALVLAAGSSSSGRYRLADSDARFSGRRVFEWALVLPLAMPAYVLAYVYTDPAVRRAAADSAARNVRLAKGTTGSRMYARLAVRSRCSSRALSVCFMIARTAFMERASGMLEAARTLGVGPWASFFRVSLPLARPAVAAGAALALMETLADYGTVSYFAVQTFTTGIYRAWFALGDRIAAAQLAAALLGFVILLLVLERLSRGRARFHNTTGRQLAASPAGDWRVGWVWRLH